MGNNYIRHPVNLCLYPDLLRGGDAPQMPAAGTAVQGILYSDLTPPEMKRLDWFEGKGYTKEQCTVMSEDVDCGAVVYLWANPVSELDLTKVWSYKKFREQHLEEYLIRSVQPCRDKLDRVMID
jgi:hypothetical protein